MPVGSGEAASIGGYTLIDRLGSGGMGVVHLGLSASGRQVAIKVVHAQYALDEEFRARFRQEVAAARRVSGAFTAPVVDADPEAEQPWMATLYVPGRTLSDIVAEEGPLTGRRLRTLALGLVEALQDIHRAGVVHRDLKPSNVLMAEDGPRVIDFGISRAADNEDLTVTGRLIGTPPFMSPEQFSSPKDVTPASDVFSLGSLLAYAATGNRPFDGGSPYLTGYQVMYEAPHLDGVPEPLRGIAARCLDKDPLVRPQLAELHSLLLHLPTEAPPAFPDLAGVPAPRSAPGADTTAAPHGRHSRSARPNARPTRPDGTTVAPSASGGGRRVRRVLIGIGTAMAVAVVGLTAAHMAASGGPAGDPSAVDAGGSASAAGDPVAGLPTGWKPWRASLLTAKQGDPIDFGESGCVAGGSTAVYCAGTGFTVTRLDAASGRVDWRRGTDPETSRPLGVRDGRVYTYRKPDPTGTYRTRRLAVLDARTGTELWARPVAEEEPSVLFDRGVLVMDENRTTFIAYDAAGRQLWTAPSKSSSGNACTPTVLDGAPYGLCTPVDDPSTGKVALLRLDPARGTAAEIATLPTGARPMGTVDGQLLFLLPKLADQQFAAAGDDQPYSALLRVNPRTGAVTRAPLPGTPRGTATLLEGVVWFVRPDGTVTAVRGSDGKRLWQATTDVENLSAPVVSTKFATLYLVNEYGRVLALNSATGAVRWRTSALADPGESAGETTPYVLLVKDALVAVAGDTAFSVRPDRPTRLPSKNPAPSAPDTVAPTPAPTQASG
ncbi:PQQ-binding-like beta-propeller repeat protein [Streptomyces sp. NPDC005799]|uniref:serine/threonine-protein kinase n=1 Tax=Streptomyces sp. NPDC005799 TaxID=3154678 RepID=UPI0033FB44A8